MNSTTQPTSKPRFAVAVIGGIANQTLELLQLVLPTVLDAQIEFFSDRESILAAAKQWPGKFLLFTNFPSDLERSYSYADSKKFLRELIKICPEAHVLVFTNAGAKILTDEEVLEQFPRYQISIERAWNWPDYLGGIINHIALHVTKTFENVSRESLLLPNSATFLNKDKASNEFLEIHKSMKELGMTADATSGKPSNPSVDIESYRIWQRSNKILAAYQYRDICGD